LNQVVSHVCLVEIVEILGVTHQRASKFVAEAGFTAPVGREGQSRLWDWREVVERAGRSRIPARRAGGR
jgi:hypothetical protein